MDVVDSAPRKVKPLLRGVSHQFAFFIALGAGAVLVAMAPSPRAAFAAGVFAGSLAWLLGVSALYHRPMWPLHVREIWKRIDHASIFVLIAGTYTPICLLTLPPDVGSSLLTIAWVGAGIGMLQAVFWVRSKPRVVSALFYLALGWLAVAYFAPMRASLDGTSFGLIVGGGLLYTVGAIVYALRRPNPVPRVFGYHEVFHVFVILASASHFAAVVMLVRDAT